MAHELVKSEVARAKGEENPFNKAELAPEEDKEKEIGIRTINSVLAKPENKNKAVIAFQNNRKMGSIASTLGLPRNKQGRGALRKLLRKQGVYKEHGGWEKSGPIDAGFAKNLMEKIAMMEKHLGSTPIRGTRALGGGVSVTRIVIFDDGSKGVFKPHSGEAFHMRRDIVDGFQTERETGAWEVAKLCKMDDLVTPCVEREYEGERGAVQEFNNGAKIAHEAGSSRMYDGKKDIQRMAAFDFIIGNEDRHPGNWMITDDNKIRAIDHGLCFPDTHYSRGVNDYTLRHAETLKDMTPKALAKPYVENKQEIMAALKKRGLSEGAVSGVGRRIDVLAESTDWKTLHDPDQPNFMPRPDPVKRGFLNQRRRRVRGWGFLR
jgi:hypothetical protein